MIAGSGKRMTDELPRHKNGQPGFTVSGWTQIPPPMFLLDVRRKRVEQQHATLCMTGTLIPAKSISTGASKMPPKMRLAQILGSGPKLVYHRQAQKHVGAHWIPNKQPTLPHRPLRGRTLSGASAPCGTVENNHGPTTGPRARQNQHPKISRRPASHPSEQPSPATMRPFLAPPSTGPKKALWPSGASPPPSG
jgi:hypothetical protein